MTQKTTISKTYTVSGVGLTPPFSPKTPKFGAKNGPKKGLRRSLVKKTRLRRSPFWPKIGPKSRPQTETHFWPKNDHSLVPKASACLKGLLARRAKRCQRQPGGRRPPGQAPKGPASTPFGPLGPKSSEAAWWPKATRSKAEGPCLNAFWA